MCVPGAKIARPPPPGFHTAGWPKTCKAGKFVIQFTNAHHLKSPHRVRQNIKYLRSSKIKSQACGRHLAQSSAIRPMAPALPAHTQQNASPRSAIDDCGLADRRRAVVDFDSHEKNGWPEKICRNLHSTGYTAA